MVMNHIFSGLRFRNSTSEKMIHALLLLAAFGAAFLHAPLSRAQDAPSRPILTQISSDPFIIGPGQHATEV
jgi:hypothetical protein